MSLRAVHHKSDIEFIESDRDEFTVADVDGDGVLDELEFLAFRHPEHNFNTLKDMAANIVRSLGA